MGRFRVFNTTFNNVSVTLVKEIGLHGENSNCDQPGNDKFYFVKLYQVHPDIGRNSTNSNVN